MNDRLTQEDQVDEKTSSKGKKESDTDKEQKNDKKSKTPQKRADGVRLIGIRHNHKSYFHRISHQ